MKNKFYVIEDKPKQLTMNIEGNRQSVNTLLIPLGGNRYAIGVDAGTAIAWCKYSVFITDNLKEELERRGYKLLEEAQCQK